LAIKQEFISAIMTLWPTEVHHGGATGPDSWAALHYPNEQRTHRPDPEKYPDLTPAERLFQRNIDMIDEARSRASSSGEPLIMVACWDGRSRGTAHAIKYAESLTVPVVYVPVRMLEELYQVRSDLITLHLGGVIRG
jgi:hypothetical protein